MDVADIADIVVETSKQNMAGHSRIWQITIDCCRLRQSHDRSLVAKSVETGRYI